MTVHYLSMLAGVGIAALLVVLGAVVVWKMMAGTIDLSHLVAEQEPIPGMQEPKASLSRFQFLVFTFVIAGLFLVLSLERGEFATVPDGVLFLLGISGGSFIISKAAGSIGGTAKKGQTGGDGTSTSGGTTGQGTGGGGTTGQSTAGGTTGQGKGTGG